jgi:hypothetical protein
MARTFQRRPPEHNAAAYLVKAGRLRDKRTSNSTPANFGRCSDGP